MLEIIDNLPQTAIVLVLLLLIASWRVGQFMAIGLLLGVVIVEFLEGC